ncbi:MAG: pimeloyl-ACP methyl ester carboxylesterase [Gammaproteobacteria bacterium]|jgi:pimeloyl-ACP methyl ester carboxylesterase
MKFPDYPFTSNYSNISGFKMHYLDEGPTDAEPVVMLHGNPSWSFYYRKLVTALMNDYRCIVPDHIGMGLSDKPHAGEYDFHFTQRSDDLTILLKNLSIKKNITLVLHDWGGMIGMNWANQFPEAVSRIIILNTGAFHLPREKILPMSIKLGRIPFVNSILIQGFNAFCRGAIKFCVTRAPMSSDVAAAYLAPYNNWANRLAVKNFVEDIPIDDNDRGYKTITKVEFGLKNFQSLPILICWGMKDFVFDETFLNNWTKHFPDAETHRFNDAGHYVLEDAANDIIPLVNTFLKKYPL